VTRKFVGVQCFQCRQAARIAVSGSVKASLFTFFHSSIMVIVPRRRSKSLPLGVVDPMCLDPTPNSNYGLIVRRFLLLL
jgi:hypothetical protein